MQVVATALSVDPDDAPETLAMIGSSIAIAISDIPWAGPTGSVVVGLIDGEYIINPNVEQRAQSRMHLTVSGTRDAVMMVEAGAKEVSEEVMLNGILFAHEEVKRIVRFLKDIVAEIGKEKVEFPLVLPGEDVKEAVRAFWGDGERAFAD